VSLAPVAGAPIKVVNALRQYEGIHARLVNISPNAYGNRTFPEDLCWPTHQENIYEELLKADIIHFHQNVLLNEPTLGIDFTDKKLFGKTRFIREWHSEPTLFSRVGRINIDAFEKEKFPLLVMAQYHERYYPQGIPVPLLTNVEMFGSEGHPLPFPPVVAFSPSARLSLKDWRWASKGYDETLAALTTLQKKHDFTIDIIEDVPWEEAVERKKKATFVIDDLVTGTFHTSGLEGLALGKPTFAFLDARTTATLATLTSRNDIPFINCSLNHFPAVFEHLIDNKELYESIGEYSKDWMKKYYHEKNLIRHYTNIYTALLDGKLPERKICAHTKGEFFLGTKLHDIIFKSIHNITDHIELN
jgi:hypothetical protein